ETTGSAFGFNIVDSAKNILIESHTFSTHYDPVKVGYNNAIDTDPSRQPSLGAVSVQTPMLIKVIGSSFNRYDNVGLNVYSNSNMKSASIISMYNYYTTPNLTGGSAIRFTEFTQNCVSAFDTFEDTTPFICGDPISTNKRVVNYSKLNSVLNAQDFYEIPVGTKDLYVCGLLTLTGDLKIIPRQSIGTLEVTRVPFSMGNLLNMTYGMRIDASAYGGSVDIIRSGEFKIVYDGINNGISYVDDYVEH